jgi:hypothetical protein
MTRLEFMTGLVAQLHAGEITKAQGRKAIRAFDAAAKREARLEAKRWRRVGLTAEQVRACSEIVRVAR